jgi:hypothetical protein
MKFIGISWLGLFVTGLCFSQSNISSIDLGDGISLTGTIETFDKSKHKFDTCDSGLDWKYICLIDDNIWFGSDKELTTPRNQLTKLTIKIQGKEIQLDVTGMFNPNYKNELKVGQFDIDRTEEEYLLSGMFSDGAGSYIANWIIIKNKSQRIKISNNEADFK